MLSLVHRKLTPGWIKGHLMGALSLWNTAGKQIASALGFVSVLYPGHPSLSFKNGEWFCCACSNVPNIPFLWRQKKKLLFGVTALACLCSCESLWHPAWSSVVPGYANPNRACMAAERASIHLPFCCCHNLVLFCLCRFCLMFSISGQELCLLIKLQITWYFLRTV